MVVCTVEHQLIKRCDSSIIIDEHNHWLQEQNKAHTITVIVKLKKADFRLKQNVIP